MLVKGPLWTTRMWRVLMVVMMVVMMVVLMVVVVVTVRAIWAWAMTCKRRIGQDCGHTALEFVHDD
jgi:hypothetical protein